MAYYRWYDSPSIGNIPDPEEVEVVRKEVVEVREVVKVEVEVEEVVVENERVYSPTGKVSESVFIIIVTVLKVNSSKASQSLVTNSTITNSATTRYISIEEIIYDLSIELLNILGILVDPAM